VFEQRRRDGTVLTGFLDGEQPGVGGAGFGWELVEVVEATLAAEVVGAFTTVSMRSARPSFKYCLIRESR
jgi:hypothetical protein